MAGKQALGALIMLNKLILILIGVLLSGSCSSNSSIIKIRYGNFEVIDKNSSTVLAAPHGSSDINTGAILSNTCKRGGFSCVIAAGFTSKGIRINVNRPTEGVGIKSTKEPRTARATKVYNSYKNQITQVASPVLNLYIEVHGSGVDGIEVALHNINTNEAKLIKSILIEEWSKQSPSPISIKVQRIDKIKMVANAVKNFGIVSELQPKFIAFEFSRPLRNKRKILSTFLLNSIKRINNALKNT